MPPLVVVPLQRNRNQRRGRRPCGAVAAEHGLIPRRTKTNTKTKAAAELPGLPGLPQASAAQLFSGADFSVVTRIVDVDGVARSEPLLVDTGSANLAVSVRGCDGCGRGAATDLSLSLAPGDDERGGAAAAATSPTIRVAYGDEESSATWWSGVRATSATVGWEGANASDVDIAAITAASSGVGPGSNAFFGAESHDCVGILGLAFDDLATPSVLVLERRFDPSPCIASPSSSSSRDPLTPCDNPLHPFLSTSEFGATLSVDRGPLLRHSPRRLAHVV